MAAKVEDLLIQIRQINESLFLEADAHLGHSAIRPQSQNSRVPIPSIAFNIPSSKNISSLLVDSGAPISVATELATIHIERASELADRYSAIYHTTCRELAQVWRPSSLGTASSLYMRIGRLEETYRHTVVNWEEELLNTVRLRFGKKKHVLLPSRSNTLNEKRPVFNHSYVSKLDAYFEQNRFPSRADRSYLAKESGMDIRQINVWFQNRRARAREMNKELVKSRDVSDARQTLAECRSAGNHVAEWQGMEQSLASGLMDLGDLASSEAPFETSQRREETWSRSSSVTLVSNDHLFDSKSPAHAFPAKYPPSVSDDPFPCCFGNFTFPKPLWARSPVVLQTKHKGTLDLETLTSLFAEMRIAGDERGSAVYSYSPAPHQCFSAADMWTRTFPAPLLALVPRSIATELIDSKELHHSADQLQMALQGSQPLSSARNNPTGGKDHFEYQTVDSQSRTCKDLSSSTYSSASNKHTPPPLEGADYDNAQSVGVPTTLSRRGSSSSIDSMPSLSASSNSASPSSSAAPSPSSQPYCLPGDPTKDGVPHEASGFTDFGFGLPFGFDIFEPYPPFLSPSVFDSFV